MPDLATLALFSSACLALALTPGPDMLLLASRSLGQGRRAAFATWIGIAIGCYAHGLMVALGLAQLIKASPLAYDMIRYAGAAYLLYLSYKAITNRAEAAQVIDAPPSLNRMHMVTSGFLTNLLNPKVILFMLALLPQFIDPDRGAILMQTMVLTTIFNLIGLAVNGTVIVFAGLLAKKLRGQNGARWPRYLLASVFTGLAMRMVVQN